MPVQLHKYTKHNSSFLRTKEQKLNLQSFVTPSDQNLKSYLDLDSLLWQKYVSTAAVKAVWSKYNACQIIHRIHAWYLHSTYHMNWEFEHFTIFIGKLFTKLKSEISAIHWDRSIHIGIEKMIKKSLDKLNILGWC